MSTETQEQRFYGSPFDDDDADLILRSSDGLHFRAHKIFLAKASPVFKDMLSMPHHSSHDDVQTVHLTEDRNTLNNLLRLIYPVDEAAGISLDDVSELIIACAKYQMNVTKKTRGILYEHLDSEPLPVYFLACLAHQERVARKAAYKCLFLPETDITAHLDSKSRKYASLMAYNRILRYYQECGQVITKLTSSYRSRSSRWMLQRNTTEKITYCWIRDQYNESKSVVHTCSENSGLFSFAPGHWGREKHWWSDFMREVGHARFDRPILMKQIPILSSTGCAECDQRCAKDMVDFVPKLYAKILEVVTEVKLRWGDEVPQ